MGPSTVVELVRLHARESPGRAALVTWDSGRRRSVTWAELDDVTDRIAAGLAAAGIGPGDRICLCLDNRNAGAY